MPGASPTPADLPQSKVLLRQLRHREQQGQALTLKLQQAESALQFERSEALRRGCKHEEELELLRAEVRSLEAAASLEERAGRGAFAASGGGAYAGWVAREAEAHTTREVVLATAVADDSYASRPQVYGRQALVMASLVQDGNN